MKVENLNTDVFLRLSDDSQKKVIQIFDIALYIKAIQKPQLTVQDFDNLYDFSVSELRLIADSYRRELEPQQMSYFASHEGGE